MSTIPANTEVEQAILDEISKYVGGPNEVAPLGGLEAKLLQTGFLIGEIIDAMQSLQDEGSLAPGPSPGLIKITGAGFARLLTFQANKRRGLTDAWAAFATSAAGTVENLGVRAIIDISSRLFAGWGIMMRWVLRLVETGAEGEARCTDVMEIVRPDDLEDIADLGLTLAEAKVLQARVQQEISAAQAGGHAVRRPNCRSCGGACHLKDYRDRRIATLFGRVTVRLPRFRCAECSAGEAGVGWPLNCRSTPELDQLQAHLSALMTYRVAADVLEQMFPVDAGKSHETLRAHTLKLGEQLQDRAVIAPTTAATAIAISVDSTFIRSCEDGDRHLEVRVGNVETETGGRQVFGAVAKADTNIVELIRRHLAAVGQTDETELIGYGPRPYWPPPASPSRRSSTGSTLRCGYST